MYTSVTFSTFTWLCARHHHPPPEPSHLPRLKLCPHEEYHPRHLAPLAPDSPHSTFCLSIEVEQYTIRPLVTGLFHQA